MKWRDNFNERDLAELEWLMKYKGHGTDGHNRIQIIQKLVRLLDATPTLDTVLDEEQVIRLLRGQAEQAGSQEKLAQQLGVSMSYLSLLLNGHRAPNDVVLEALKLCIVYAPVASKRVTP